MNENLLAFEAGAGRKSVLLVDDHADNIDILKGILKDHYDLYAAKNGQMALKIIDSKLPDIVLLDIMMPGMNGYEVCEQIKANPATQHIPVIFITAMTSVQDEQRGFEVGAVDFITKPITPLTTLARVANHIALSEQDKRNRLIIEQRTSQLKEALVSAVNMLSEAGTYNDEHTGSHMWRMADYCAVLARSLGWPEDKVEHLQLAAPMHDTGKIGIPDSILKAPRKLTEEEWVIMRQHPSIGAEILGKSQAPLFQIAAQVALGHHEKWDGSGYPKGLAGEDIPIAARIVALADVFDALTMERPYKKAWPIEEAYQYLRDQAGSHFDPKLVELFIAQDEEVRAVKRSWEEREQMNAVS
ncbi:response regulator [Marinomonas ostreistagni]|uniref:response regulator n=1 Tax=Marinomonas ostreistagni TaxID=359209 RepID=UPI00195254BB|nr:two-component system response regulator [Marinomonas ostreistagni]MBM6550215.1 two-component system response regulator [Marinomonas ostreistagni]